jgi:TPR repeat protein
MHQSQAGEGRPVGNWLAGMRAPGNPQVARENVDLLFPNGLEVECGIPTAIYWLNRAADSEKAEALAALDDRCREGRGCKRDYQEAHRLTSGRTRGRICAARAGRSLRPKAGGQA